MVDRSMMIIFVVVSPLKVKINYCWWCIYLKVIFKVIKAWAKDADITEHCSLTPQGVRCSEAKGVIQDDNTILRYYIHKSCTMCEMACRAHIMTCLMCFLCSCSALLEKVKDKEPRKLPNDSPSKNEWMNENEYDLYDLLVICKKMSFISLYMFLMISLSLRREAHSL